MKKVILVIFVIVMTTALMFAYSDKSEANKRLEIIPQFEDNTEMIGNMRVDKQTKIPAALYNVSYHVNSADPETMARQYLLENAVKLHIKKDLSDIEFVNSFETSSGYRIQFIQTAEGYPLYRSSIKVSINRENKVVFVMNGYRKLGRIETNINVSQSSALQIAKNYLNINGRLNHQKAETMVYNVNLFKNVIVQKVTLVPAENTFGDWEILVDANTGKILRAEDRACYFRETGSGWVFDPDPITNAETTYGSNGFNNAGGNDTDSLTAQLKQIDLLEITEEGGFYRLEGPFASIIDFEAPYTGLHQQNSSDFHYTRSELPFEAVNIYYHVDHSMRYLQEVMDFEVMPYQYDGGVHFDPHGLDGEINAYYSPSTGHIAFGSPSNAVDAGEDHAIIIHELGHGIHDWITDGGLSQVDGLSEGLSDYWAQSYTRSLEIFEPGDLSYDWFGLWGLQPFLGGSFMRVTDFPGHYPESLNGQVHHDGQLWSSSLMSIYDLIGREATDRDCWEGISMTDINSNQRDAAFAFMQADIDIFNGDNMDDIMPVFTERGYIEGPVSALFESDVTGGQSPVIVNFLDMSFAYPDPIISWEWDFENDGIIDSYDQNPSHTYTESGLYTVSLTVSDGANVNTKIVENYISVNSGILVYEGVPDGTDYSGTYIYETFSELGIESAYSNLIPTSLTGYNAVFISLGNIGQGFNSGTFLEQDEAETIEQYLQSGGKVYIESSSLFFGMEFFEYPNFQLFRELFGIQDAEFSAASSPINGLSGIQGTITEDMNFTSSSQVNNWYVELFSSNTNGNIAFTESDFGDVAVQGEGDYGQKTFNFSYSLADLTDGTSPSTRHELLMNIVEFLDIPILAPMFTADPTEGPAPLPVIFFDNSLANPEITSWAWDFENDGIIDSSEQNPSWIYNEPDSYTVSLTVENAYQSQTKTIENFINVSETGANIEIIPLETNLGVNHPNPFNPTTEISFALKDAQNVTLEIFNVRGRKVKTLINDSMDAGLHQVVWEGIDDNDKQVSSGIYFYKMKAGSYTHTKKMILMK